ncbi:substrate-binding periplasmic protein [Roseateles sp. NT4]|uniref:substrate-binding periplasmic protein n=1 Tax=Roseateles sp. NT4 TaxID=3453715 RepID=UPI003EEA3F5D
MALSLRLLLPLLAGLLCWAAAPVRAEGCPQPLRIGFSDAASPPGLLGSGPTFPEPPGWEVAAVREALKRLGCQAELLRLPNRRLSASLAQGGVDIGLLFGTTPERLRSFAFPLDAQSRPDLAWAPVFGHLALFGRSGEAADAGWDGQRLPVGLRVGVLTGSVQEAIARSRGWATEPIGVLDGGLAMLQARRFDLLLTTREVLTPEQRADLVEWSPGVAKLPFFAPASPPFAQRHPEWTRSFWRQLCQAVRRLEPDIRPADCGTVPATAWR